MHKIILASFAIIIGLMTLPSCEQHFCCGKSVYYYTCTTQTDTVFIDIEGLASYVNQARADSFAKYQSAGYSCFEGQPRGEGWDAGCCFGVLQRNRAERGGDSCFADNGQVMCSASSACD